MGVLSVPEPDFMQDPELAMFTDSAAKFLRQEAPTERIARWREAGQVDREIWTRAGEMGFLGVSIPEEYGGAGGDFRHDVLLVQQIARNAVEGFAIQLHNVIVLPYVLLHGTEEQKRTWLPRLCSGNRFPPLR